MICTCDHCSKPIDTQTKGVLDPVPQELGWEVTCPHCGKKMTKTLTSLTITHQDCFRTIAEADPENWAFIRDSLVFTDRGRRPVYPTMYHGPHGLRGYEVMGHMHRLMVSMGYVMSADLCATGGLLVVGNGDWQEEFRGGCLIGPTLRAFATVIVREKKNA